MTKKYAMRSSSRASTTRYAELEGVVPTGNIVWSSDNSGTKKGWKICVEKQGPTPEPTPSPPAPIGNWRVTDGKCKVEQEDPRCISSTSYPQSYPKKDHCLIQVHGTGTVQVSEFDTEGGSSHCWDWLKV